MDYPINYPINGGPRGPSIICPEGWQPLSCKFGELFYFILAVGNGIRITRSSDFMQQLQYEENYIQHEHLRNQQNYFQGTFNTRIPP